MFLCMPHGVCAGDERRLVINELLASNSSVLADGQSEYDDWIEIHNAGDVPVDVAGMYLTDDLSEPTLWRFPSGRPEVTTISPGGYVLVWADKDIQDEPGLHAGFALDAAGEAVGLFDVDGIALIDAVTFAGQTPDISFGRYPDGHEEWQYMVMPSPANANVVTYDGFVEAVEFSQDRGFYDAPFRVTLSTSTPEATIWYTVDGSEPYTPLPRGTNGRRYTGPLEINGTVCVRAKAVRPGWKPSVVRTHTYIFLGDVLVQRSNPSGFPEQWGDSSSDYGMDGRITRHPPYGDVMRDALLTHRTVSLVFNVGDLFDSVSGIYANSQGEGESWERPVSMEILDPAGGEEVQVNAGLRIQGSASRSATRSKHNLRLLFKGIYGTPKLEFPVFEDWPVREFNTLILRGGNGDAWFHPNTTQQIRAQYIRDQWPRDTQHAMGRLTAGQCYVHLYLNGLYWGLYHVIERPDAAFFAEHLGGEPEEYDVVQHKGGTVDGDRQAWDAMMVIANEGLVSSEAFTRIQQYLDVPNLIDYILINFYMGNTDWDRNNWYGGRRRAPGAGFRFLSWDSERTFLALADDVTGKDFDNQPTHLHQQLTANAEYRMQFADHVHRHFFNGGLLTPETATARWRQRADEIRLALAAESARWGDNQRPDNPYTPDVEWQAELDFLCNEYFPKRTGMVLEQLRARGLYPDVDAPVFHPHGGAVETGFAPVITAPAGTIWFTTDGSDPRIAQEAPVETTQRILVSQAAAKHILVPKADIGGKWRDPQPFDDSDWLLTEGLPGGVGYERSSGYQAYISADLRDRMYGVHTTCYIRIPFTFDGAAGDWESVLLRIRYDDGFVAYLNGVEIARRNFDGVPAWDSRAVTDHADDEAVEFEPIDVSAFLPQLHPGPNLLAIHGLNGSVSSSDFLIGVELIVTNAGRPTGISPTAERYGVPVALQRSATVRARTLDRNTWSALSEATFAVGPVVESLRITEIMYHPMNDDGTGTEPNAEFIELKNVGNAAIDLNLVQFSQGIHFTFGPTELAPGDMIVVVEDPDAFRLSYGDMVQPAGRYTGKLDNGGERIRLQDAIGRTIADFQYKDGWHPSTDGRGFSLTAVTPEQTQPVDLSARDRWRTSARVGGSPGADD